MMYHDIYMTKTGKFNKKIKISAMKIKSNTKFGQIGLPTTFCTLNCQISEPKISRKSSLEPVCLQSNRAPRHPPIWQCPPKKQAVCRRHAYGLIHRQFAIRLTRSKGVVYNAPFRMNIAIFPPKSSLTNIHR